MNRNAVKSIDVISAPVRRARGFTLVEILIAVFIAAIIFTIGFTIIAGTIRARNDAAVRIRSTENARLFFQMLERDLASAYPYNAGPHPIVAITDMFQTYKVKIGQYSSAKGSSDINIDVEAIQFYTRSDQREVTDERVFVRYYINNHQQLCREVQHFIDPNDPVQLTVLPLTDPALLDSQDTALFERARGLSLSFHTWKADTKEYIPDLSTINLTAASASHLKVRLSMYDAAGSLKVADNGEVYLSSTDTKEDTRIDSSRDMGNRVIYKVLLIPSSFLP
jgi:prepilin-type N-terminal cleavage/methylation domain-containing protein